MKRFTILYTLAFASLFASCNNNNCVQFEQESYSEETMPLEVEAKDNLNTLYNYLNELDYSTQPFESYRLLFGSGYSPKKTVVRIDHSENGPVLSYKIFTAKATPDNQDMNVEIVEENQFNLSEEDWDKFISLIYKKSYWTMPEMVGKTGYKGVSYFIEGIRPQAKDCGKRTQHIVTRWNPSSGDFYALCNHINRLLKSYQEKK